MLLSEERRIERDREACALLEAVIYVLVLFVVVSQRLPYTRIVVCVNLLCDRLVVVRQQQQRALELPRDSIDLSSRH